MSIRRPHDLFFLNLTCCVTAVLVFIIVLLWTEFVRCQEFFSGKVLEVDRGRMELTVKPQHVEELSGTLKGENRILVRIAQRNNLPRDETGVYLPQCVFPGNSVRLWGRRDKEEKSVFLATDIRGCRGGGCEDPTGVRSRLQKHRPKTIKSKSWWSSWILSGEEKDGEGTGDGGRGHEGGHGGEGHGGGGGHR